MAVNHWQEPLVSWSHIWLKVLGGLKGIADFPERWKRTQQYTEDCNLIAQG
jgi:hypothetical protein